MRRRIKASTQGFTVIEVLVSIALLSVIVLVVLMPLTGFFGLTRRSGEQVGATQTAQRTLEHIRGDWLDPARYDQSCLQDPLPQTTADVQVQVTNLDQDGQAAEESGLSTDCAGTPTPAPMKRVRVTVRAGETVSVLSLDVARP